MPESSKHMFFVEKIISEAKTIIPSEYHVLIHYDKPDSIEKPSKTFEGFVPDLRYAYKDLLIIGEAKTAEDVEREHSIMQYESYFDEAAKFEGKAVLIFACPWFTKNTIKNIIRLLYSKKNKHIECHFLCEIGNAEIL